MGVHVGGGCAGGARGRERARVERAAVGRASGTPSKHPPTHPPTHPPNLFQVHNMRVVNLQQQGGEARRSTTLGSPARGAAAPHPPARATATPPPPPCLLEDADLTLDLLHHSSADEVLLVQHLRGCGVRGSSQLACAHVCPSPRRARAAAAGRGLSRVCAPRVRRARRPPPHLDRHRLPRVHVLPILDLGVRALRQGRAGARHVRERSSSRRGNARTHARTHTRTYARTPCRPSPTDALTSPIVRPR